MIYLIDDNKYGQMSSNYKLDFTKELMHHQGAVNWVQAIPQNDMNDFLSNATSILIHDSFDDKEDKERIVATAKMKNIPYCLFSNGFIATVFDGCSIKEIRKDRFYNNLIDFINHFAASGEIDLRLLALGRNYDVERALIIQDRLINGALFNNRVNFNYEVAFPSGSREYKDLRELIYLCDPSIDFSDFEDNYNSKDTTAYTLRLVIISLVKNLKSLYEK